MNADGSRSVSAQLQLGARTSLLGGSAAGWLRLPHWSLRSRPPLSQNTSVER
jgi:hypothetical protein